MAETAAHLVDYVIPQVPVRQWVLSFPIPLRCLFAAHPHLLVPVLQVVERALQRRQREAEVGGLSALRLLFEFPATFLKYYVLRRHFTGGLMGFQSSMIGAYSRFARIARMLEAAQRPDQTVASPDALNERAKAP